MKRREFITLLGGAAAAWPLAARAQQGERVRRIGVLAGGALASDADTRERKCRVRTGPAAIGLDRRSQRPDRLSLWLGQGRQAFANTPRNWSASNRMSSSFPALPPWRRCCRRPARVPIVFVSVADPVGAGFVESMARPGGNATGFIQFEYSLSGKWLELVKEIAPSVTRVAVLRDPAVTAGVGQFARHSVSGTSIGLDVGPVNLRDAGDIERAVTALARSPNGALVVTASALSLVHQHADPRARGAAPIACDLSVGDPSSPLAA